MDAARLLTEQSNPGSKAPLQASRPSPASSGASAVVLLLVPQVMSRTNIWGLSVVACWPSWATWFCHELRKYSKGGMVKLLLGSPGCQS